MTKSLQDKVVVVTGGGRGIGQGIACHLATLGARLAIIDLDGDRIKETVDCIVASGAQARSYVCDITVEADVERAFSDIVANFGAIHGLVNNAGIIRDGVMVKVRDGRAVSRLGVDDFDRVIDVCLKGAFLCAREAVTHMVAGDGSDRAIVNISSGSFRGNYGQTNYSAAKAGLVAMSRVWAKEYGRYNIRSMTLAPGAVDTDLLRSMPAEGLKAIAAQIPLRRIGQIDNIAHAVAHIFTNDYLTGSVLEVNGGLVV
jgi:3-oxoacyl-[acyl-carrier protein] reductase